MGFDLGLNGKAVFVTGAASGIGKVLSQTLAGLGAKVAITDRDTDGAKRLSDELNRAGNDTIAIGLDVSDRVGVEKAVQQTVDKFGTLQFAVNNAGVGSSRGAVHEASPEEWDLCIGVNLTGVFNCMRAQIPPMLNAGKGAIVNLSSIFGVVAVANTAAYTAAKHGVAGLTKTAALDYAESGIRVNAVAPGYVDTPLLANRNDEELQAIVLRHPMSRMATPKEIADLIIFLLSDRASFITGSVHLVDGGYTAR